jgi:drug/metabolite transporter (DMT)-like permease
MGKHSTEERSTREWVKEYIIGLGLGVGAALYGVYSLLAGSTYMPGLRRGTTSVHGSHGVGAAIMYVAGGLFLVFRFFLHRRCRLESTRSQVYLLENALLVVFIGSAFYVLLNVGTAG